MSTEAIMSDDPRDLWQRLSRGDIRKCMDALNIELTSSQSLDDGVKLMQAMGANVRELLEWEAIPVKDSNGQETIQYHPKRVQPIYTEEYVARRDQILAQRLEEAEKRVEKDQKDQADKTRQLEADNRKLQEQLQELTKLVLDMNSQLHKQDIKDMEAKDIMKLHWKKFQKVAKDNGLSWKPGEPREPIIEALLKDEPA